MAGDGPAARRALCTDVGLLLARSFLPALVASLERQLTITLSTPSPAHLGPSKSEALFPNLYQPLPLSMKSSSILLLLEHPSPRLLSFIRAYQRFLYGDPENPKRKEDQGVSVHFKSKEHRLAPTLSSCSSSVFCFIPSFHPDLVHLAPC